jgi:flagellar hook-basal body complex protein FliE
MSVIAAIPMAVQQVAGNSAAAGANLASQIPGAANSAGTYANPFASVIRDAIQATQSLETSAANAVTGLVSGSGVDVHTAMIATEKSNLSFQMMLAFRNKAVSAYQQLMGMQF